jgi:sortase (surface protein transpeptidase)
VEPIIEPKQEPVPSVDPEPNGPPVANPQRIQIPAIEVDAAFEYVGLTEEQAMDVPKDPAKVAWYKDGPRPGEKGNSIVGGHIDWGGSLQVFGLLKSLGPGDVVTVTAEDGRKFDFVVQWSRSFDFDAGGAALGEIFGSSDKTELTMITCGGTFDRATHNYLERLVVRAVMR